MFAIASGGQLIAALVAIAAMLQVGFILATPTETLDNGEEDISDLLFSNTLAAVHAGIAILACTAYVIMRGLGI